MSSPVLTRTELEADYQAAISRPVPDLPAVVAAAQAIIDRDAADALQARLDEALAGKAPLVTHSAVA